MPHEGLQSHPPLQSIPGGGGQSIPKSPEQIECESEGGTWNQETKICTPKVELPTPETFTDPKTGRATGITLPDGRTFFGLSPDEVAEVARLEQRKVARPEGTAPVGTAAREQEEQLRLQGIEKERQRLITEETPSRVELSPELSFGEKVPLLGGIIGVVSDILRPLKKKLRFKTAEQLAPQELRTLALTEIERVEIEKGLTISEQTGKLLEATGFSRLDIFGLSVKDLVETPSENAIEVLSKIRKEKRRLTNIETNVKLGYLPVTVAQEQVRDIEHEVQAGQSRIKLLVANSPELKFNSDFVNTMETEILATQEKIFQTKFNILEGKIQDPTDMEIYKKLIEQQSQEEDFE